MGNVCWSRIIPYSLQCYSYSVIAMDLPKRMTCKWCISYDASHTVCLMHRVPCSKYRTSWGWLSYLCHDIYSSDHLSKNLILQSNMQLEIVMDTRAAWSHCIKCGGETPSNPLLKATAAHHSLCLLASNDSEVVTTIRVSICPRPASKCAGATRVYSAQSTGLAYV